MKEKVLSILKEYAPEFVSGEFICKSLSVSRTAIWKYIQALRTEGYEIISQPHLGYRLLSIPDRLYPQEIIYGLKTKFIGQHIFYYENVSSTNKIAREKASQGAPNGSLVITEEQTQGQGRLGRNWFSPYGKGIWCSLILYPHINPGDAPPVTMLTAVAVAQAIKKETEVKLDIKWPNDLLLNGKKLCGILTEMNAEMERINYLIIGMGLNVNIKNFPEEIKDVATSLKAYTGKEISRVKLLKSFLEEMEYLYHIWLQKGFSPILKLWKELCVTLNCPVKLISLKEVAEGWAEDVGEDGSLIVRLTDGSIQRFIGGEISLRKI